jgi:hypothetical protein
LEKEGETLKWGNVYLMFTKSNFLVEAEYQDELKIFKNIQKYGIFRVTTRDPIFPFPMPSIGSKNMMI